MTIRSRSAPAALVAAMSRTHFDAKSDQFLSRLNIARRYGCGSSVKFCHLAQGDSDVYPRLAPTSEWDVAAGCAILAAVGNRTIEARRWEAYRTLTEELARRRPQWA